MTVARPTIYLVGAGPGEPDLLTVRAAEIIKIADLILYDMLVPQEILDLAKPDAQLVCAKHRGYGKAGFQQKIAQLLAKQAHEGRLVCRLKSGDPMIFANGAETIAFLQQLGCNVSIIPGISSGLGGPVLAGIPLSFRGYSPTICLVSMHDPDHLPEWSAVARTGVSIFYMALAKLEEISTSLIAAGLAADTPAWLMENAGRPSQRIVVGTLDGLARLAEANSVQEPAILLTGEVLRKAAARIRPWSGEKISAPA